MEYYFKFKQNFNSVNNESGIKKGIASINNLYVICNTNMHFVYGTESFMYEFDSYLIHF